MVHHRNPCDTGIADSGARRVFADVPCEKNGRADGGRQRDEPGLDALFPSADGRRAVLSGLGRGVGGVGMGAD